MKYNNNLKELLINWKINAVVFDLDGTLVDNNPYHLQAWKAYLKNINKEISETDYNLYLNGRTWRDAMEYIYGRKLPDEEAMKYYLKKAKLYREMYVGFIKPVAGLTGLLNELSIQKIPMAIATSGIEENIDFMFEHIPIRQYFSVIVNSSQVVKGKPSPEIYLKAASLLGIASQNCLVFEDAAVGVRSAKDAGMKVIGITTTETATALSSADAIIKDYRDLL